VFLVAGSSFAAHFKYGYDAVCKLLEAASCQGDPSLQNGCLHLLSTALGTSGVSPSSHAALKRTLAVVRPIPILSKQIHRTILNVPYTPGCRRTCHLFDSLSCEGSGEREREREEKDRERERELFQPVTLIQWRVRTMCVKCHERAVSGLRQSIV
jgi:hypothetical protein